MPSTSLNFPVPIADSPFLSRAEVSKKSFYDLLHFSHIQPSWKFGLPQSLHVHAGFRLLSDIFSLPLLVL
jgi:hypothetical protein